MAFLNKPFGKYGASVAALPFAHSKSSLKRKIRNMKIETFLKIRACVLALLVCGAIVVSGLVPLGAFAASFVEKSLLFYPLYGVIGSMAIIAALGLVISVTPLLRDDIAALLRS
jgi:hypothetical protein